MNEKHGFLYLFSGLALGLGIGLLLAWVLAPVQFTDTTPISLRSDFKDEYRFMIASSFSADNDLPRAEARLGILGDPDAIRAIKEQSQRMLAGGAPMNEIQMLADLTTALQIQSTEVARPTLELTSTATSQPSPQASFTAIYTSSPTSSPTITKTATVYISQTASVTPKPAAEDTSTPEPKPISTLAPRPTQAPSPTTIAPFSLVKKSTFCEASQPGLLQVFLNNAVGKPAPGIEIIITWSGGEEHFFTGLKPEIGYGYADFTMKENVEYALSLSAGSTQITGLKSSSCPIPGSTFPGGIRLEFKQK